MDPDFILKFWASALPIGMVLGALIVGGKFLREAWLDWQVSRDLARERRETR